MNAHTAEQQAQLEHIINCNIWEPPSPPSDFTSDAEDEEDTAPAEHHHHSDTLASPATSATASTTPSKGDENSNSSNKHQTRTSSRLSRHSTNNDHECDIWSTKKKKTSTILKQLELEVPGYRLVKDYDYDSVYRDNNNNNDTTNHDNNNSNVNKSDTSSSSDRLPNEYDEQFRKAYEAGYIVSYHPETGNSNNSTADNNHEDEVSDVEEELRQVLEDIDDNILFWDINDNTLFDDNSLGSSSNMLSGSISNSSSSSGIVINNSAETIAAMGKRGYVCKFFEIGRWSESEVQLFKEFLCAFGCDWRKISKLMLSKTEKQVESFFINNRYDLRCQLCGSTTDDHLLLLCDSCDRAYHTYCLNPPLTKLPSPNEPWYCTPACHSIHSKVFSITTIIR